MIINSYQNKYHLMRENTGGHAVDTWTGLLVDLIYNFDIANLIWMDLNIWDWKATSRHVEIWDKGLSCKALRLKQDFRKISTEFNITRFNCIKFKEVTIQNVIAANVMSFIGFCRVVVYINPRLYRVWYSNVTLKVMLPRQTTAK
jgi:hypothetical protein